jgi:hypothetical protein
MNNIENWTNRELLLVVCSQHVATVEKVMMRDRCTRPSRALQEQMQASARPRKVNAWHACTLLSTCEFLAPGSKQTGASHAQR